MGPALRTFASVLSGYFIMGVIVFAIDLGVGLVFAGALAAGSVADGSGSAPGPSPAAVVLLIMLTGAAFAAIAGGALAARVGRLPSGEPSRGPRILAALVLVLGVMANLSGAPAYPSTVPGWYLWSIPILGIVGVMLGARLVEGAPVKVPTT